MSEPARARWRALYDDQCEVCQAGVAWLRLLDRGGQVEPLPIHAERLACLDPRLDLERCLAEIHVLAPDGSLYVGWDGMARLARLFPPTRWIGLLGGLPLLRSAGRAAYGYVARNRYALSKCRGGACRVASPAAVRRRAPLGAFWSCYTLGMVARLPLMGALLGRDLARRAALHARLRGRRLDFLGGKLSLCFLGGLPTDLVPLLFGEQFTMVLYDGLAIDPGSPRMRRSLERHLAGLPPGSIRGVVATHHHEEHVGNLGWLRDRTGAPLHVGAATAALLEAPARLPWARRAIIGQPPPLRPPFSLLERTLASASGTLEVLAAPGHCDDHVVLYDPAEKVLVAGDAFMGAYFSTPNPDVDSRKWIASVERLLLLDVEILVEGHGHVRTLRRDVPDLPGVVIREHPRRALEEKLAALRWLGERVQSGLAEGLPVRAVEASCFPWQQGWAWESFLGDSMIRLLSLGHFSRAEVVRSFVREPGSAALFPTVYRAKLYRGAGPRNPGPSDRV